MKYNIILQLTSKSGHLFGQGNNLLIYDQEDSLLVGGQMGGVVVWLHNLELYTPVYRSQYGFPPIDSCLERQKTES